MAGTCACDNKHLSCIKCGEVLYLLKNLQLYSLLGRTAASTRLNTTFRGLAPSPSSGKTVRPRRLY
jgi:hypothetical protein